MAVSKVLSIEITDLTTHICEIGYNKKNPVIYKSIIFENPQYSVEDGFVLDRGPYKNALKEELNSARVKTKDVVFSLSSSKIINREVTIPDMKKELIAGLIENERNEYFPMDTTGHVFAFEIIEKIKETKQQRISIYAAPDILVKNMMTLAGELELNVVAIDYSGNAIYQWLKRNTTEPIEMYLQINEKNSQFTILDGGMLELQRNMNFGVNTLVNAMNDARYYDKELEYSEALLKLKDEKLMFSSFEEADAAVPETEEERKIIALKARLTDATRPMIGNLSSVLEYYNTKKRGAIMRGGAAAADDKKKKKGKAADSANSSDITTGAGAGAAGTGDNGSENTISDVNTAGAASSEAESSSGSQPMARIYIGGAGIYVQGIKNLIENEFNGIEVIILQKLPGINIAKENRVAEEHSTELIACIGSSFPTISFYQKSAKEAFSKTMIASLVGLVLVIAAAVIIILNGKSEYDKQMERKGTLIGQRDQLEAQGIEQLENEYAEAMNRYASIKAADEGTFNHNENWNEILSYLETESVSDIIISSIASTENTLMMNVVVTSKQEAAELLLQYQKIPYFSNVAITAISENIEQETEYKTVSFSITCTYQKPERGEDKAE
ncbi:MAG: pilus assembly protein PilM [Lachnospiraceae bacterium]|nr:pilus assembly protein PilM [Lachnospiraceae bacterium]